MGNFSICCLRYLSGGEVMISSEVADTIYMWSGVGAVVCAVVTAILEVRKHRKPRAIHSAFVSFVTVAVPIATAVLGIVAFLSANVRDQYSDIRISENERATASANQAAAVAKKEAGEAAERTAVIQNENAKLQSQLEADRSARLALEKKIAPRRLSSSQKERLVKILLPFSGQLIRVMSPPTGEQTDLAIDFVDVFKQAGWKIVSTMPTGVDRIEYLHEPQGIQLSVDPAEPSNSKPLQALENLRKFLYAEKLTNLKSPAQLFHDRLPGVIELSTARKPG